ncbi:DCD (Development and Cell Death) domain protein [Zea mays]|uniref:DCD (Development and Cell Death) domain protein n=1 Tax=Zea mays TaxID=4577 RepID=A0A1D6NRQ5_MAIZE|nr:DCD (Development and Cell Death) domain protein [Zea mays]
MISTGFVVLMWRSCTVHGKLLIVRGSLLEQIVWRNSTVMIDLLTVLWTPLIQPTLQLLTRITLLMLKQALGLSQQGLVAPVRQFRHSIRFLVVQYIGDE